MQSHDSCRMHIQCTVGVHGRSSHQQPTELFWPRLGPPFAPAVGISSIYFTHTDASGDESTGTQHRPMPGHTAVLWSRVVECFLSWSPQVISL